MPSRRQSGKRFAGKPGHKARRPPARIAPLQRSQACRPRMPAKRRARCPAQNGEYSRCHRATAENWQSPHPFIRPNAAIRKRRRASLRELRAGILIPAAVTLNACRTRHAARATEHDSGDTHGNVDRQTLDGVTGSAKSVSNGVSRAGAPRIHLNPALALQPGPSAQPNVMSRCRALPARDAGS